MKRLALILSLIILLISCNTPTESFVPAEKRNMQVEQLLIENDSLLFLLDSLQILQNRNFLSKEDKIARKRAEEDSLMFVFNSLMNIKVDLPQLIDYNTISADCVDDFNRLARETKGELKVVANSSLVTKTILQLIELHAVDGTDLMILIDKTASMGDDIDNIRKGLKQVFELLRSYRNMRLAVGAYGDKNVDGKDWYEFSSFEGDFRRTLTFINHITLTGGGDSPESVYDGIHRAFHEDFWISTNKRMVILLGDAPSLDSSLTTYTARDIIQIATQEEVYMNFYPIVLSPVPEDIGPLGTTHMESIKLIEHLYPNPSRGVFTLDLFSSADLTIEIFDQGGKRILQKKTNQNQLREDLSLYPNGLYTIRVYDQFKNVDSRKLILSK